MARDLVADAGSGWRSEGEVLEALQVALDDGLIRWSLETPMRERSEDVLRDRLATIADEEVAATCLAAMDRFLAARDAVCAAAGDAAALDVALERLEREFTSITGGPAHRRPGETYAARTIIYEDARRDADVTVGPALLERFGPALGLVLDGARWMSHAFARQVRERIDQILAEARAETGSEVVELTMLYARFQERCMNGPEWALLARVERELQRRWRAVLGDAPGDRTLRVTSRSLARAAAEIFACPGAGWPNAHFSPDLLIAAESVDAAVRGEVTAVVGEIHFFNSICNAWAMSQHPDPASLARAMADDHPGVHLVPFSPKSLSPQRLAQVLVAPHHRRVHLSPEPVPMDDATYVRGGELVVVPGDGGARLRTRDGRVDVDVLDLFASWMSGLCSKGIALLPPAAHAPRVMIDDVVIAREGWQFVLGELPIAEPAGGAASYVEVLRWAARHGLPRHAFVRVAVERKPMYLDLDSPVFVDAFVRLVRRAREATPRGLLSVTEMLPGFEELWLRDAAGARYASELRIVAVDRRAPVTAGSPGDRR